MVESEEERSKAFRLTVEKLIPGRWENCRQPNEAEAKATSIAAMKIEDATLKVRTGPVSDIESDLDGPHWAGVVPITTSYGSPIPDAQLAGESTTPEHILKLIGRA